MKQRKDGKRLTPGEMISHSIQSFTANECNKLIGARGAFWQTETYDHVVRSDEELQRATQYVENNPVKAGLCASAVDYTWSSARLRKDQELAVGDPITKID